MKKLLTYLVLWMCSMQMHAEMDSTNYLLGNVLYEQGNYSDAIIVYENVIEKKGASPEVNFNLGNAYFRAGMIGKSILHYERALELDPGDADTQFNLDIANLRIRDQVDEVDEIIFATWWRNLHQSFSISIWCYISIALIWIAVVAFSFFKFSPSLQFRKTGFYIFIFSAFLFVISIMATFAAQKYMKTHHYAIVMEQNAILKSEPNESSKNLTLVHEGLKLQILDEQNGWFEIRRADGNEGWIVREAVEEI